MAATGSDRLRLATYVPDLDSTVLGEGTRTSTSGYTVDLTAGTLRDGQGNVGAVIGIENLAGTGYSDDLRGDIGDNFMVGDGGNDIFRLQDGGVDRARGRLWRRCLLRLGSLTSADIVNGGDGVDTLVLQGHYRAADPDAIVTEIENISILGGGNTNFGDPGTNLYDYVLTTHDFELRGRAFRPRINGAALLAGEDFTFNGSAETNANFVVYGGKGKDTLTGGFGNDIFIYAEDRFAPGDTVNGGPGGYDGIFFRGNYTIDFNAPGYFGLMTSIENMTLMSITDERYSRGGDPAGFDYNITLADNQLLAGIELTVSGVFLMAGETMILDGSQELDGRLPAVRRQVGRHPEGRRPERSAARQSRRGPADGRRRRGHVPLRFHRGFERGVDGPDTRLQAGHGQDRPEPDRRQRARRRRPGVQLDRLGRVQRRRPASFAPTSRAAPGSSRATRTATASPISSSP